MSTFDDIYGADPNASKPALAGPGTVSRAVPAAVDSNLTGLSSLHPGKSPTPWVIGMVVLLAIMLHPRFGFGTSVKGGIG